MTASAALAEGTSGLFVDPTDAALSAEEQVQVQQLLRLTTHLRELGLGDSNEVRQQTAAILAGSNPEPMLLEQMVCGAERTTHELREEPLDASYVVDRSGQLSVNAERGTLNPQVTHLPDDGAFTLHVEGSARVVRVLLGSRVLACELVSNLGANKALVLRAGAASDQLSGGPHVLEVEVFGAAASTPRATAVARSRVRSLVEKLVLFDTTRGRSLGTLLAELYAAARYREADDLIRQAQLRLQVVRRHLEVALNPQLRSVAAASHRDLKRRLTEIATTTDQWERASLASHLPEATASGDPDKLRVLLDSYLLIRETLRPAKLAEHTLPFVDAGDDPDWVTYVQRYETSQRTDRANRRGDRLAMIVTHVPVAVSPVFELEDTPASAQDPAVIVATVFGRVPFAILETAVNKAFVAPRAGLELATPHDPHTPLVATTRTHSYVTVEPLVAGNDYRLRACGGERCVTSGDAKNVRAAVGVQADSWVGLHGIATVAGGLWLRRDRFLELHPAGDMGPDQAFVARSSTDRSVVVGALGLGLRVCNVMATVNLGLVGHNARRGRTWLGGLAFRIPRISRNLYLHLMGGFTLRERRYDLEEGDILLSTSSDPPTVPSDQGRAPMFLIGLAVDFVAVGEAAGKLVGAIGGD